jgi:hypothetical protein
MSALKDFSYFAQHKYAWPGGYPMYAVMNDGEAMCHACVMDNAKLIVDATINDDRSGWAVAGFDINWEDDDLMCCNCNARIESAYGEA